MRILITGGAGYLGTVVSQVLLDAGHQVRVLDSLLHGGRPLLHLLGQPGFQLIRGDIRDAAIVTAALAGVDGVVHLAAIVGDPACAAEPERTRAVNLDAALLLFEQAVSSGVTRMVFASTCSNYGKMADTAVPASEDHPLRPVSLYAETKVEVERRLLAHAGDRPVVTVLRFATLFGLSPRMRFDLTVNEFTAALALGRRLTVYGEQFWRPYVHVRDAARAIRMVLEASADTVAGRVFNVGATDENHRKIDVVDLVRERTPNGDVAFVHKAEDPRDYKVSFQRIQAELGFGITLRVRDGVDEIASAVEASVFGDVDDPAYRNTR